MDIPVLYKKMHMHIPGISYYAALLISNEIADINRFPDYEHLSSYARNLSIRGNTVLKH